MTMNIVNYLSKQWKNVNLNKGDFGTIHSNTKPLLRHLRNKGLQPTIDDILRSFLRGSWRKRYCYIPHF